MDWWMIKMSKIWAQHFHMKRPPSHTDYHFINIVLQGEHCSKYTMSQRYFQGYQTDFLWEHNSFCDNFNTDTQVTALCGEIHAYLHFFVIKSAKLTWNCQCNELLQYKNTDLQKTTLSLVLQLGAEILLNNDRWVLIKHLCILAWMDDKCSSCSWQQCVVTMSWLRKRVLHM